jgi:hypothetical protein
MNLIDRIKAFDQLGNHLRELSDEQRAELCYEAKSLNAWFNDASIEQSLRGIAYLLEPVTLKKWLERYKIVEATPKKIGIAMAGNIPMVGFHDLLCVLITGNSAVAKLSSQDYFLMSYVINQLIKLESRFENQLNVAERLNHVDAIIATGSDNTARYFEYYFRNIPHVIRKNRSSCAIIMGEESPEEIVKLGIDIFSYFGLGCRNVSKIYLPQGYDIKCLLEPLQRYSGVINHNKYVNNYDYRKSILLVNRQPHFDNGFILLVENTSVVSPVAVLHIEYYASLEDLNTRIDSQKEKIQCIVSAQAWYKESVPFGKAQLPEPWDYADQLDTIQFLLAIKTS